MYDDPIVAEIRKIRDAYAKQFNYDLDAISRDIKAKEKASGHQFVRFPARPCGPRNKGALPPAV